MVLFPFQACLQFKQDEETKGARAVPQISHGNLRLRVRQPGSEDAPVQRDLS